MRTIISLTGSLVLLAACSPQPEALDAVRAAAVSDSVRAEADIIANDVVRNGPNGWMPHFADSAFYMVNDGAVVFPSYDSAATFVANLARGVDHMELVWSDVRVTPLAPGLATLGAAYNESVTDTAGQTISFGGYMTATMVHRAAGWRIQNLHWSSPTDNP